MNIWQRVREAFRSWGAQAGMAALAIMAFVGFSGGVAGAQAEDPIMDSISTVEAQVTSYAGPVVAAIVAVGLAFVGVKLAPRIIDWVSNRIR